ncbi:MAG TPA: cytochrome c oxidase subunit 3 [Gemmatimonadaceae bacterium]|nr:cytochrome c oxidase subunit 3 [Gemmatimonadaceae bacterium]
MATAVAHEPHGPPVHAHHTSTGLDHRKIAIWAFIGSECMLFASLISTYLAYKGRSVVGPYPHEWWCRATGAIAEKRELLASCAPDQIVRPILNIPVTSQSTFVLLMSSLAMVLALAAVENRDRPKPATLTLGHRILGSSRLWLGMTALMGATFLGYQAFEFTSFVHEGLTIKTNLFGSSFFTLTGTHGTHVTVGVLWLLTLLAIDFKRGLTTKDTLLVDICALYWHFVDVVWIAIFTLVYLIR